MDKKILDSVLSNIKFEKIDKDYGKNEVNRLNKNIEKSMKKEFNEYYKKELEKVKNNNS